MSPDTDMQRRRDRTSLRASTAEMAKPLPPSESTVAPYAGGGGRWQVPTQPASLLTGPTAN
eukprot:CAMPEP_0119541400 /NCGR_PEP_ID=MMETSP1344-20130328/52935_1 /TAXON_ID=236787 /ORGANISM="Florenciella parvula, Strain CCMP2471" /LENGTH=60 /DNA_ID=CAMNT_0007585369 /DNA_START=175 /DNA_END=355 /DNA_ORIENTATION=+